MNYIITTIVKNFTPSYFFLVEDEDGYGFTKSETELSEEALNTYEEYVKEQLNFINEIKSRKI
jgi:hypothetical protein